MGGAGLPDRVRASGKGPGNPRLASRRGNRALPRNEAGHRTRRIRIKSTRPQAALPAALALALLGGACTPKSPPRAAAPATASEQQAPQPAPQAHAAFADASDDFLYLAAQNAARDGDYRTAAAMLEELVRRQPDALEPALQLAELLAGSGRAAKADSLLKRLLARRDLPADERPRLTAMRARVLLQLNRPGDALSLLDDLDDSSPEHAALKAEITARAGRPLAAAKLLARALRDHDNPDLRLMRVRFLAQAGRIKQALAELETMQARWPDDARAARITGELLEKAGKPDAAEKAYRAFLARHPDALGVLNALGRLLTRQNRLGEAVLVYRDMAAHTGNDPDVLMALGLLHFQRQDYKAAAEAFHAALNGRDNPSAHFYLAACLEALNQPEQAAKHYAAIPPEAGETYARAQVRLAAIDFTANRLEAAARRMQTLLQRFPTMPDAWALLSGVRLEQKRYRQLLKESEPALALRKPPPRLLINRAIAHDKLKEYDALEAELKRLLEHDPRNAEALNFLGYSLADRGLRLKEAERLIRRALAIKPDDGYYLDSLAWALHKQGRSKEAIPIQRKALEKVPDDPLMLEHLGDMLWRAGRHEEAIAAWKKALAHKPPAPAELRRKIRKGLP